MNPFTKITIKFKDFLRYTYFRRKHLRSDAKEDEIQGTVTMEFVDLEREYTPVLWSNRLYTPEHRLNLHINLVTAESEIATNNVPHKLEIEYGSTPGQKLDIFGTDLPNESPILVFIHGGYWPDVSREISRYPAKSLYPAGVKTIIVGYDLCPAVTLAEVVNQIQNAARYIFEYAEKMNSRGVYFAGHGTGAHLVAKLLASSEFFENTPDSHHLQGAFLISGLYDLREVVNTSVNRSVQLPHEWAVPLSPQFDCFSHLQSRRIRIYIFAAQNDSPTFKRQSREFYELLHNTCLMQNMYLEIKDDMDHHEIVECFANSNNYLKNLLIHDIRKHI